MNRSVVLFLMAAPFWFPTAATAEFNVRNFGAVPDGRTDCAPAIQRALDAAAGAGGGRVVIPPAEKPYLVSQPILVRASRTELFGAGATVQLADNAVGPYGYNRGSPVLHVTGIPEERLSEEDLNTYNRGAFPGGTKQRRITDVTVSGLTIDGNIWNQAGAVENNRFPRGLLVSHACKVLLRQVHVKRAWVSVSFSEGAEDSEAQDCTVTQWHNDAFDAASGARQIRFVRCTARDALSQKNDGPPGSRGSGWEIEDGVKDITLTECVVKITDATAFVVRSHNRPSVMSHIRFIRCQALTEPGRPAWIIVGRSHATRVEGVELEDCQTAGELKVSDGADSVRILRGKFGQVTLDSPRQVHIRDSAIGKFIISAKEKSDGLNTYRPAIVLESLKLATGAPEITGDARMVQILPR